MTQLSVNIDVDDLAKAVAFYTAAFGLTEKRRLGPGIVELSGGTAPIFLLEQPSGSSPVAGTATRRSYQRHWTPVHLDFLVRAIEPALARAVAAGATLEGAIRDFDWGRMAVLADPFGHGFCLIEFVGRGYAELEGNESK